MARPRTPTRVLELRGAYKKDPQRKKARAGEPHVTEPMGQPPDCLDEAERARWHEVAEWGKDWLRVHHRGIVEQLCRLWMLDRRGKATGAQQALLVSCWGRLGLTPSDESKVKVPPAPAQKTGFEEFA